MTLYSYNVHEVPFDAGMEVIGFVTEQPAFRISGKAFDGKGAYPTGVSHFLSHTEITIPRAF